MQMCYYFLNMGHLPDIISLRNIDQLAMIIAAVCHDLGHDGFTNSYHLNAITKRAINSNDRSIQEHFHAAELFNILANSESSFLEGLSRIDFMYFRSRVISCILATDMAHHQSKIDAMKQTIKINKITNTEHLTQWIKEGEMKDAHNNLKEFKKQ